MEFMIDIDLKKSESLIEYPGNILLTGSCFTEHIGKALAEAKFNVLQNPHGILFDPESVCNALISYIENKAYTESDLFYLNEVWQTWEHHSRFSGINKDEVISQINHTQQKAHEFLKNAEWLIITLGSSFSYRLTDDAIASGKIAGNGVANCHRAPSQWFRKQLLEIENIISLLDNLYHRLRMFNPQLRIIYTISPVRHLRDGVVENNRSKARLIEAVHHLVEKFEGQYYFPAYELVIDVLRDYRFYDIDFAHPNYQATEFVLEKFTSTFLQESTLELMKEIKKISIARKHRAFQPETNAHRKFMTSHAEKVKELSKKYPFLDFREELEYFNGH